VRNRLNIEIAMQYRASGILALDAPTHFDLLIAIFFHAILTIMQDRFFDFS